MANDVVLGRNVTIYNFVNLYGCEIGDGTKIGSFVEIQKDARVGRNCKISSHTFICEGLCIEDEVFIGHNVNFINDKYLRVTAEGGASMGKGAVITRDVPTGAIVAGNPARVIRNNER
ncbi:MAG: N-acetyltransferase [Acidobacteriota bacterium]|nr:N-acetyltransferase [Acidobacteriota bacterium]